jgi:4'-phosphopantetheinyl transferase
LPGQVDLWRLDLSEHNWPLAGPEVLCPEERERYARYKFARDARRFALRRTALRTILSTYTQVAPEDVKLAPRNRFEKPGLDALLDGDICFNASSSGDLGLVAVARGCEVGVDVEKLRPVGRYTEIAERYFTEAETRRLDALPERTRLRGFYRTWTAKEALLKALGIGLPGGLERFDVGVDPDLPPVLLHDSEGKRSLWLYDADPAPGYMGALAVDCPDAEVRPLAFEFGRFRRR